MGTTRGSQPRVVRRALAMTVIRLLARPLLASVFIADGIDAVLNPPAHPAVPGDLGPRLAGALPVSLPRDPAQLHQINGGVQIVAGLMLATGRMPRVAAAMLAATLVPAAYDPNRVWAP